MPCWRQVAQSDYTVSIPLIIMVIIITRSIGTVHRPTFAKARLNCRDADLDAYLDLDCHQNLIICSLVHCQPFLKISCKSVQKFLHKIAQRQTNNASDANLTIRPYATPPPRIPNAHRPSPQVPEYEDLSGDLRPVHMLPPPWLPASQSSPKAEKTCPDSRPTGVQNFTPLCFSAAEKSVTVQTNKITHSKVSIPRTTVRWENNDD